MGFRERKCVCAVIHRDMLGIRKLQEIEMIQFSASRKIALLLKECFLWEAQGNNVFYKTPHIMAQHFLADIYNPYISHCSNFLFLEGIQMVAHG